MAIDEVFLLEPTEVIVVDPADYVDDERVEWQRQHLSEADEHVRDICREMWNIPGVRTKYSCLGEQVHKMRGEGGQHCGGAPNGFRPHIHFELIQEAPYVEIDDKKFRIDQETLERFDGKFPHIEFFKHLYVSCAEGDVPFSFGWYDSSRNEKRVNKTPTMGLSRDLSADEVMSCWVALMGMTKRFQREQGFTGYCYHNRYSTRCKAADSEVLALFKYPLDEINSGVIAHDLDVGYDSMKKILDRLVEEKKLYPRKWSNEYCLFLTHEEREVERERELEAWAEDCR